MSHELDIDNGRLVYTCNCGWVDTGHANPQKTNRAYIGASSLWEQIISETGRSSRWPDANGFRVGYRQDMVKYKISIGETGFYLVNHGLTTAQKESVALAIFMGISTRFEDLQASWPYNWAMDSGFSEEDLVSDLIGFYKAVRPATDYMSLCGPVSKAASHAVWKKFGAVGANKNRTFKPIFHACAECTKAPSFPKELQAITPAKYGGLFRDWLQLDDWIDGIPPISHAEP